MYRIVCDGANVAVVGHIARRSMHRSNLKSADLFSDVRQRSLLHVSLSEY